MVNTTMPGPMSECMPDGLQAILTPCRRSAHPAHAARPPATQLFLAAAVCRRANDRGTELFAAGRFSEAFDCFTEAIRLRPSSPIYHCNRAAVGLKLRRAELAAEDAQNAAQRDPACLKAWLRGGKAALEMGKPESAAECYERALKLVPTCSSANKGLELAQRMGQSHAQEREAEMEAGNRGLRPGLPRTAVPPDQAAEQLLCATDMLAANPRSEALKCAVVEARTLCGRYAEAEAGCEALLDSVDRLYLEAEIAWRKGEPARAMQQLALALERAQGSAKCIALLTFIQPLEQLQQRADEAMELGCMGDCVEACEGLLRSIEPAACTGLACRTLARRAEAHAARRAWQKALADLDAALELEGAHAQCLRLRAEVHRGAGQYTSSFLDLQRLAKVAPGTPGLHTLIEEAAMLCLNGGAGGEGEGSASKSSGCWQAGRSEGALAALGLGAAANAAEVRRAYLRLAGMWHPDKWSAAGSSVEERRAAEEEFKKIQQAYELLTGRAG
jgi:DnaJ family protein C protein 7